ncbi:hypothetical protein CLV92_110170 [Kineococcus xinjiangensis]|uniref:Uncharacterized protein n=1 Tax=Kineococcus xinjiangensis TaxID=512762 RepID=A0A2S6IH46_9ACTN|nr:hypothetical protein [Kineococcus xinjiangensis]PPK93542.1 hypothetical protein CLV92_110170 [Kineococcus xinjiangensis]
MWFFLNAVFANFGASRSALSQTTWYAAIPVTFLAACLLWAYLIPRRRWWSIPVTLLSHGVAFCLLGGLSMFIH